MIKFLNDKQIQALALLLSKGAPAILHENVQVKGKMSYDPEKKIVAITFGFDRDPGMIKEISELGEFDVLIYGTQLNNKGAMANSGNEAGAEEDQTQLEMAEKMTKGDKDDDEKSVEESEPEKSTDEAEEDEPQNEEAEETTD